MGRMKLGFVAFLVALVVGAVYGLTGCSHSGPKAVEDVSSGAASGAAGMTFGEELKKQAP